MEGNEEWQVYRMRRVAFFTLGCKVNTYETESMKRTFEQGGFQVVPPDSVADVYVVNTCTVTHLSDRKSRQMIRRARRMNPRAIIAAVGCYAQIAPQEVSAIEGVNLVVGNNHKGEILRLVEEINPDSLKILVSERKELNTYEDLWVGSYDGQTRAFLKIQDGCNQFCSYCIIPLARGGIRSRNADSILNEAKSLAQKGFKEIVLTGIHLTSYGMEKGEKTLADVICDLNGVKGIRRIRLGSLEPLYLSDDVVKRMAEIDKLCPHFHMSLQSGCDETLKRMNRRYTTAEYAEIVCRIRGLFQDAAITTDVMTGFPGETQEEFRKTCDFIESIGFSRTHIFQYSPRKGTRAAEMANQISSKKMEERSKILKDISEKSKNQYRDQYLGRNMNVLFEQKRGKLWEGLTRNYIPVRVNSDREFYGEIKNVRLEKRSGDVVLGQIV